MSVRHLYLVRHGEADALGAPTDRGRRQAELLGRRLASAPIDVVWHSPLERAAVSADLMATQLPRRPLVDVAEELIDHIPYVPPTKEMPPSIGQFFDGFDPAEARRGRRLAGALTDRFGSATRRDTHEVLVTHAYPIAWLVREALGAPPASWLSLNSANAALTIIERRPLGAELVAFNDTGHLPPELRWTGFGVIGRP